MGTRLNEQRAARPVRRLYLGADRSSITRMGLAGVFQGLDQEEDFGGHSEVQIRGVGEAYAAWRIVVLAAVAAVGEVAVDGLLYFRPERITTTTQLARIDSAILPAIGERRAEIAHERIVLRAVGDEESVHSCPRSLASMGGFRAGTGQLQGAGRSVYRVFYRLRQCGTSRLTAWATPRA